MTVDPSVIGDRLRRLDEYLTTLRHLARLPREQLIDDFDRFKGYVLSFLAERGLM
jgi:hypothetical protein